MERYELVTDDVVEPTTEEIVRGFFADIEGIFDQITDDPNLTDDQKARLIQVFEDVDQYDDDVNDIFGVSTESA